MEEVRGKSVQRDLIDSAIHSWPLKYLQLMMKAVTQTLP